MDLYRFILTFPRYFCDNWRFPPRRSNIWDDVFHIDMTNQTSECAASNHDPLQTVLAMSELRPLKYGELECKGNGLTYRSYSRATPAQIIAALSQTSQPTDHGRVSKSTKPQGHSKAWWEAQVRLYGFKCSNWTIDGMKEVLMDAVAASFKVPAELQGVEEQLNHDYQERQKRPQSETPGSRNGTLERFRVVDIVDN